jgi:hypothetical protein
VVSAGVVRVAVGRGLYTLAAVAEDGNGLTPLCHGG